MAWDSDKPGDSEKIRSLGTVIRPNWKSLEQGEDANAMAGTVSGAYIQQYSSAYIERDGRANNLDPTTEADTLYIYCKQDANAVAEAYLKDPAGNTIQITEGGQLGSQATNLYANSISYDGTVTYDANNMIRAWGLTNSAFAAFSTNNGFVGITNTGTGVATVDVTGLGPAGANFADGNAYGVVATAAFTSVPHVVTVDNRTATSFRIRVHNVTANAPAPGNTITSIMLLS